MRFICSPTSLDAMNRLNYGNEYDGDLLEIIIDDELYKKIWNMGFFDEINIKLNKFIDDYEDEEITELKDLLKLREINEKYESIHCFFMQTKKLIDNAIDKKTGMFFFF